MRRVNAGLDAWSADVSADRPGRWSYRVEGWSDPYGTRFHDAVIKVGAQVDVELMLEEGARVLERAVAEVARTTDQAAVLRLARRGRGGTSTSDGGHDAIHPDLGTFDDFGAFLARARELGLEVALDLALNCAPDHPWVADRPEWFMTRADGSIAYAESPPKKYQDIYPLNFDNDPEGLYAEIRRIVRVWIDHGVTIFRVDNPHTEPLWLWERLIADVAEDHPEIIWLAPRSRSTTRSIGTGTGDGRITNPEGRERGTRLRAARPRHRAGPHRARPAVLTDGEVSDIHVQDIEA